MKKIKNTLFIIVALFISVVCIHTIYNDDFKLRDYVINDLNENQLKKKLGKHYYISQGQFANLPKNIIDDAVKAGNAAESEKAEAIATSLLEAVWKQTKKNLKTR